MFFVKKIQTGPRASDIIFRKIQKLALEPSTALYASTDLLTPSVGVMLNHMLSGVGMRSS